MSARKSVRFFSRTYVFEKVSRGARKFKDRVVLAILTKRIVAKIIKNLQLATIDEVQSEIVKLEFVGAAGFNRVHTVYVAGIGRLIRAAYAKDRLDIAEMLVHWSFVHYALRLKSEAAFGRWISSFSREAAIAGARYQSLDNRQINAGEPLVIAFITRAGPISNATLDHILPIISFLEKNVLKRYKIIIYFLYNAGADALAAAKELGVEVRVADPSGTNSDVHRLVALRDFSAQDNVDVAVWVHAFESVFALFGMRIAPVQILLSQYLHPNIDLSCIDDQITYGSPVLKRQSFNGKLWRVIPSCLAKDRQTLDAEAVFEMRSRFGSPDKLLIGTIARTEKIAQPEYLECIVRILRANSSALFLWTGVTKHQDIHNAFVQAGVVDQTHFVGWVDVSVFSRVIDLHCDTFPMCNGLALLDSMSAGTACISTNSLLSYFGRDLLPAVTEKWQVELPSKVAVAMRAIGAGELPIASKKREYISLANDLIADPIKRKSVGNKCRLIYHELYENEGLMGAAFDRHLREILQSRP